VRDPASAVFLEIFAHPKSAAQPLTSIGTGYSDAMALFADRWQSGEVRDLVGGLRDVDRQINALLRRSTARDDTTAGELATGWRNAAATSPDLRAAFS